MRTLPDYLRKGMKMILIGSNPGDRAARVGHYYAGRGNQFWPIMYESGVIPEPLSYEDDRRILEFGIGMTDLVKRPTRTPEEIERQEFAEGRVLLAQKLEDMRPRVVAFNGKMVYEKFTGRTSCKLGLQKEKLYGAGRIRPAFHRRAKRRQRTRRKETLLQETRPAFEEPQRLVGASNQRSTEKSLGVRHGCHATAAAFVSASQPETEKNWSCRNAPARFSPFASIVLKS